MTSALAAASGAQLSGQPGTSNLLASQAGQTQPARINSAVQTALDNPQANTSSLVGGENALNLINSAANTSGLLSPQSSGGIANAVTDTLGSANVSAQELFGAQSVSAALRSANQRQAQLSFLQAEAQNGTSSGRNDQEQLVERLSELNLNQLAVLEEASSEDPSNLVPNELLQSFENLSQPDLISFRQALREARDIVEQREAEQASQDQQSQGQTQGQSFGSLGSLLNESA